MVRKIHVNGGAIGLGAAGFILPFVIAAGLVPLEAAIPADAPPLNPDKLLVVDCLLPGQLRKLGGKFNYLGPRRAVRATTDECEIRGGEYVAYDRADYATALRVWMPLAEQGDAKAQVYVGEIYEKGLGVQPDYAQAAAWYDKAAKQGDVQGLNHSAYLYEQGLGVPKDPVRALNLYRAAAGLKSDELTFVSEVNAVRDEAQAKIDTLTAQLDARDQSAAELADQLDQTRRQLAEQRAHTTRAERDAADLRGRAAQLQATAATPANAEELARVKGELADREAKLAAERAAVAKLENATAEQGEALRARLAEAEREDTQLRQQLGAAQAQAAADRSQRDAAQAKAKAMDAELGSLQTQMAATQSALRTAQDQMQRKLGSVDPTHDAALRNAVAQQQLQLERQQAVIAALGDQRQQLKAELGRLQAVVASAEKGRSDDKQAAAQSAATAERLRAELASARSELLRKTTEQKELAARLDADEHKIAEDNRALNETASGAGTKEAELRRLNGELASREASLAAQRAQLAALQETIARERGMISEFQQRLKSQPAQAASPAAASAAAGAAAPAANPAEWGLGQSYALIVGNAEYAHLPQLKTAVKDALDVERVLSERYGFKGHTRMLLNATRAQMMNALNEMMKSVGENDNLVIYYAGHGALDETNLRGYWLPIDADRDNPTNWVSDRSVTDMVSLMPARHILIIADSCYSGAMLRSTNLRLVSKPTKSAEAKRMAMLARLRSRTVLTSGGNEPVLDNGPGGNSIFAREFIDLLSRNTDVMEASALYNVLSDRVHADALRVGAITGIALNQTPRYSVLADAGHLNGEFLFVPTVAAASPHG